jgi:hypothetical protein
VICASPPTLDLLGLNYTMRYPIIIDGRNCMIH